MHKTFPSLFKSNAPVTVHLRVSGRIEFCVIDAIVAPGGKRVDRPRVRLLDVFQPVPILWRLWEEDIRIRVDGYGSQAPGLLC